ncbi:MAG TPA: LacI family DNA-binding transcriptional regulator [Blastocatellia bacterium]|nr:LacI family DNA-binding transcriptional regulator [Blastocatellia bacterium]
MPRRKSDNSEDKKDGRLAKRPVSLKDLAAHVGLSPSTLSLVLNDRPAANSIPQATKDRIFEAARGLNYRPHFLARSLRTRRSHTLGVLVPEISGGYTAAVMSGIEEHLLKEGYFYIIACHRHKEELLDEYPKLFLDRCVDGIIAVDTVCRHLMPLPVAAISGHDDIPGLTNIVLNHTMAARLALKHLVDLGHRQIAIIKGQVFSSDTRVRWDSIRQAARDFGLTIPQRLVSQLESDSPSPEVGYVAAKKLLARGEPFTALFAFNDISAIGAIAALREAGRGVPEEVSVVGFDDVDSAAFYNPALTTIRQPLRKMGKLAAETLLQRIMNGDDASFPEMVTVEPELIVRQSTAPARQVVSISVRARKRLGAGV